MKENERIAKLFSDLYDGSPWLDVTIVNTLDDISASEAFNPAVPGLNTIWEIVNHMVSWREAVLERLSGNIVPSPDHNFFEPVTDPSGEAWEATLARLQQSQEAWIKFLSGFPDGEFDTIYPPNGMHYYEHIHGIIQHDAYHLGQLVILAKVVRLGKQG